MRHIKKEYFLFLVIFLVLSGFIFSLFSSDKVEGTNYNVVVISMDTARADRLSVYDSDRPTSPNLEELSENSFVFEEAISPATTTIPSHMSLFTSKYPSNHGIVSRDDKLSEEEITMAEVFSEQNYSTVAFVDSERGVGGDLRPKFGYPQGFDKYTAKGGGFRVTVTQATNWLNSNNNNRPFFMFVHGYDPHTPYVMRENSRLPESNYSGVLKDKRYFIGFQKPTFKSDNFNRSEVIPILRHIRKSEEGWVLDLPNQEVELGKEDLEFIRWRYDGGIRRADRHIGRLLDALKAEGVYNNTIIVVLGDHGETLGEHRLLGNQYFGHGYPYDEAINVPLIIKVPDFRGKRVSQQVELLNLFPTLVDLTDVEVEESVSSDFDGESLLPVINRGEKDQSVEIDKYAYVDSLSRFAIRTEKWKYIEGGASTHEELFKLDSDRYEKRNVIMKYPHIGERLKSKLKLHKANFEERSDE